MRVTFTPLCSTAEAMPDETVLDAARIGVTDGETVPRATRNRLTLRLGIVDFDVVDESNLQRQVLYGPADVGRPKAVVAAEKLRADGLRRCRTDSRIVCRPTAMPAVMKPANVASELN